jgi:hypothetical protein
MKQTLFSLRSLVLAGLLLLATSFSNKLHAQYQTNPVTVTISQDLFNDVVNGEAVELQATGQNTFDALQVANPNNPILNPPCINQMTPALAAYLEGLANSCCCPIFCCVQGANCAWYLYVFMPNSPQCNIFNPNYSQAIQALQVITD